MEVARSRALSSPEREPLGTRRALLWIGGAHVSRQVMFPESLIHLLDRRFPNQTLVALALDRKDMRDDLVQRLGSWPSLMAAPLGNSGSAEWMRALAPA